MSLTQGSDTTTANSIPRMKSEELTPSTFDSVYSGRQPVIVSGVVSQWKAYRLWSAEYLRGLFKNVTTNLKYNERGIFDLHDSVYQKINFSDAVDLILSENGSRYSVQQQALLASFPELLNDIDLPYLINSNKQMKVVNLWFGGRGYKSPLHYDGLHNLFAQVVGAKRMILFPPDETSNLYPFRDKSRAHCSQLDIFNPNEQSFPGYARARLKRIDVHVEPGELLYVPLGWWHAVESLDVSVSINFWWTVKANARQAPKSH